VLVLLEQVPSGYRVHLNQSSKTHWECVLMSNRVTYVPEYEGYVSVREIKGHGESLNDALNNTLAQERSTQ